MINEKGRRGNRGEGTDESLLLLSDVGDKLGPANNRRKSVLVDWVVLKVVTSSILLSSSLPNAVFALYQYIFFLAPPQ